MRQSAAHSRHRLLTASGARGVRDWCLASGRWRSGCRQTDPASGPRPPTQMRPFSLLSVLTAPASCLLICHMKCGVNGANGLPMIAVLMASAHANRPWQSRPALCLPCGALAAATGPMALPGVSHAALVLMRATRLSPGRTQAAAGWMFCFHLGTSSSATRSLQLTLTLYAMGGPHSSFPSRMILDQVLSSGDLVRKRHHLYSCPSWTQKHPFSRSVSLA